MILIIQSVSLEDEVRRFIAGRTSRSNVICIGKGRRESGKSDIFLGGTRGGKFSPDDLISRGLEGALSGPQDPGCKVNSTRLKVKATPRNRIRNVI